MSRVNQDQNSQHLASTAGTEQNTERAENESRLQEYSSENEASSAVALEESAAEPLLVATVQEQGATDLTTLLDTPSGTDPKYTLRQGQVCSMDSPGDTCPSVGFLVADAETPFFPRAYWERDAIRDSSSGTGTTNTIEGVNRLGVLGTGGWGVDGSGITPYKSDAGSLVGHVKKLGWLGTDQYGTSTSEHSFAVLPGKNGAGSGLASGGSSLPGTGGTSGGGFGDRPTGGTTGGGIVVPPPAVIPPQITISRMDGDHYIASGKMAESDPTGFLLKFTQTGGSASGSLVITFTLDGTAQAGHEYHSISGWEVYDQNGVFLTNSPIIHTGGTSYSLTLLSGQTSVVLRIPLYDDRLTDTTTSIDYTVTGANCALVGELKGSVQIVDDPSAEAGGWTPPGTPGPIGSSGPLVNVALSDGSHLLVDGSGNPLTSSQVMENDATSTFYQIFMTNRFTGADYGATDQDITLVVKLGALNGLIIGDAANPQGNEDFLLDFSTLTGIASSYSFHPATGELRLTVPAGFTGTTPLVFSGKPVADQLVEASNLRETLQVDVISTKGNESTPGTGCATEVVDVPTLAISVESQTFSESDTSGLAFSVKLSSPSLKPLTITLKVGDASDTATAGSDYVNKIIGPNGQSYTVDGSGYVTVTLPKGTTEWKFRIPLRDDHLSEGSEKITVSLNPQVTGATGEDFFVSPSQGKATATIVDDTNYSHPTHAGGARLDGPLAQLWITDAAGNKLSYADAQAVMENGGPVYYKLVLVSRTNPAQEYTAQEDVTITLQASGANGATLTGAGKDFGFDVSLLPGATYNPATGKLTIKIPAGSKSVQFTGNPEADANKESSYKGSGSKDDRNNYTEEKISLTITGTKGNESSVDTGHGNATTTIVDVPLAFIAADVATVSESDTTEIHYTVNLSSPSLNPIALRIKVGDAADTTTAGDDYLRQIVGSDGTVYPLDAGGYVTITLPAGTTEWKFHIPLVDDRLSETSEKITVSIAPEVTGAITENYHPAPGAGSSAVVTIKDDTDYTFPGHGSGAALDGPIISVVRLDGSNNPVADGSDFAGETNVQENDGAASFRILLTDGLGGLPNADEAITVTFKITGFNSTTRITLDGTTNGTDTDIVFDFTAPPFTINSDGTVSVIIPAGQPHIDFTGALMVNASTPGKDTPGEGITIDIVSTSKNESTPGASHEMFIAETPVITIAADAANVSESDTDGLPFTVTLQEPAPYDFLVKIQLGLSSDGATRGTDYALPSMPLGAVITAYDTATGIITIKVPAGSSSVSFKLPVVDDHLSETAESVTLKLLPQNGATASPTDKYQISVVPGNDRATTTIVDDTDITNPSFTGHHNGAALDGPLVQLWITDAAGSKLSQKDAQAVMENGGPVYYKLVLVSRTNTAQEYTAQQDVTVELQAAGANGAVLAGGGTDFGFDVSSLPGATYNPVTGKLSITIPAGSKSVQFTGRPVADANTESTYNGTGNTNDRANYTEEKVSLTITGTQGNESSLHTTNNTTTATLVDVPTVSVSADVQAIFESNATNSLGPAGTSFGNEAVYTFSLTSPSLTPITVQLDWATGTTADNADYKVTINGVTHAGLPNSITFPAGTTSYSIKVTAKDDKLTELDETLKVTLKPENGVTGAATDNYHVTTGPQKDAVVTIKDDSAAGVNNPHLDGPTALLVYCDSAGNVLYDNLGKFVTAQSILESNQEVYYKVGLFTKSGTNYVEYTADENVVVTLRAQGPGATGIVLKPSLGTTDFTFDTTAYSKVGTTGFGGLSVVDTSTTGQIGLQISVGKGTTGTVFKGNSIADYAVEGDERFNFMLTGVTGNEAHFVTSGPESQLTTTIIDTPKVSIVAGAVDVSESAGSMSFTLHLTSPLDRDVTIQLEWSSGSGYATPGTDFGNIITVTIPKGQTSKSFTVPITDDALSEGAEKAKVTILPNDRTTAHVDDPYQIDSAGSTVETIIRDDTDFTAPGHAGGAKLDGPMVQLLITNAAGVPLSNSEATSVMENGGPVYYKLVLVDRVTGLPYSGQRENVTVTIQATGGEGGVVTGVGADGAFTFTGTNGSISTGGLITVDIPSGSSSVIFSYKPKADNAIEGAGRGPLQNHEHIDMTITGTSGNESSIDASKDVVKTTIIDVPTVGVVTNVTNIFESTGHGTQPNEATFTFELTSASLDNITVNLDWLHGTGLTTGDYTVKVNGVAVGALPPSLSFPKGTTSVTVTIVAKDDKLTELAENLTVTIKPHDGSTSNVTDPYHVSNGTGLAAQVGDGSATIAINDDTTGFLDGPVLALYVFNKNNVLQDTRTADVWEETPTKNPSSTDPAGKITYRLKLLDKNGNDYNDERELITVNLKLEGVSTATYGTVPGTGDYYLDLSVFPAWAGATFNSATGVLTLKVPANQSFVDIPVFTVADNLTETNRTGVDDEGFKLSITGSTGNESTVHAGKNSVETTILEEFAGVQVGLSKVTADNIAEGQNATFRINLSAAAQEPVIVTVIVSSTNPEDLGRTTFTIIIPAGQTSKDFHVPIFNDTFTEGTESYTLTIQKVQGGEALINEIRKDATGTIVDDMNGPVLWLDASASDQLTSENVARLDATYTLRIDDALGFPGSGVPSQDVYVTLGLTAGSADVSGAAADAIWQNLVFDDSRITNYTIHANGTVTITIPQGYNAGSLTFTVKIVDDDLSESREDFKVTIVGVQGSEATIDTTRDTVTTVIVDDTEIVEAPGFIGDPNTILDGPYVHVTGVTTVSESAGAAVYTLTLYDEHGNIYIAKQDVQVIIKYTGIEAESSKDFTELPGNTYVTIPAGSSSVTFSVPIADDSLSENPERYKVEIEKVTGNEARIPADPAKSSIVTTIVDDTDWSYPGHANGAKLDGPILSISGSPSIHEGSGPADYLLELSEAPKENMTVTILFEGFGGLSVKDINIAAFLAGAGISNIVYPDPLDLTRFTFDVVIATGAASWTISIPPFNDDFTEANESFRLTLQSATGAEGRIIAGQNDSAQTLVRDDSTGPRVSITAWDNDIAGTGGFTANPSFTAGDASTYPAIRYRINLSKPASEDVTITIRTFDGGGNSVTTRPPYGSVEDTNASSPTFGMWVGTDSNGNPVIFNPANGHYTLTISGSVNGFGNPTGHSHAEFTLPHGPSGTFYMEVVSTKMSESDINQNQNQNLVTTHIAYPPYVPVDPTYVKIIDTLTTDNNYTPTRVVEGNDAIFELEISNANNNYTKNVVVNFQLRFGTAVAFNDYAFTDAAKFTVTEDSAAFVKGIGIGAYAGLRYTYNKATGILVFSVAVPQNTQNFQFRLPMANDNYLEGTESYKIIGVSVSGSECYFTGKTQFDMQIADSYTTPVVSLEQTGDATEGGSFTYTLTMNTISDQNITVYVKFGKPGDTAESGKDYIPLVIPVIILAGETSATFNVSIPEDEYTEGNEFYTIWVNAVSGQAIIHLTDYILQTVIKDHMTGPSVSFPRPVETSPEDEASTVFNIVLDRPAVENSWITVEVTDGTATYGTDYTLSGLTTAPAGVESYTLAQLNALGGGLYHYTVGGRHYVLIKIPQGDVKAEITIPGMMINDKLTEVNEAFRLEIIKALGGEVQLGSQTQMDQVITDVLNGPGVNVTADKISIDESDGADPAVPGSTAGPNGTVTYTFALGGSALAEENVTITFVIEKVGTGRGDGIPFGTHTIVIPAGQNSVDFILDSLLNDSIDERNPQDKFQIRITGVVGNEAHIGAIDKVETTIVDDDHAPVAVNDTVTLLVPPAPTGGGFTLNVINNDYDADNPAATPNLGLTTIPGTYVGVYGTFVIDGMGNVTYTLNHNNPTIKALTRNETIAEDAFVYSLSDGSNVVTGRVVLSISAKNSYTGTAANEWVFGSGEPVSVSSGGGKDTITASAGNDTLRDFDGNAILNGGAGNDYFVITDKDANGLITPADMSVINGGTGVDSIAISGSRLVADFTGGAWGAASITGIEVIELSGVIDGWNTIKLDSAGVQKLNSGRDVTTHPIRITGNVGDCYEFATGEGWAISGGITTDSNGRSFYTFVDSSANKVLVETHLAEVRYGTPGNDVVTLENRPIKYVSGTGNDYVIGGSASGDLLYGDGGNDTLDGGGGLNLLDGGAGNDLLIIRDTTGNGIVNSSDFMGVYGGTGVDTLRVDGTNVILDLGGILAGTMTGIETIDISGSGNNGVIIPTAKLTQLSASLNGQAQLRITGNAGDTFELTGAGWTSNGKVTDNGTWYKYTNADGHILYVSDVMTRVVNGTVGNDSLTGFTEDNTIFYAGTGHDTIKGGAGNDTIYGGDGADFLYGGAGTNLLDGGTGNDIFYHQSQGDTMLGGAGNDLILLADLNSDNIMNGADFTRIDGGIGVDTIRVTGTNKTLDLTAIPTTQIQGIETFDLFSGGNHIILNEAIVDHLATSMNGQTQLRINGVTGDTFSLQGNWEYLRVVTFLGKDYHEYKDTAGKLVWVENTLGRVYNESTATSVTLDDMVGATSDTIDKNDFVTITASGATNTLVLGGTGKTLDLSALGAGKINGITTIDLGGAGQNHIVMDVNTLTHMGASPLRITGDAASDTYELLGAWTFEGVQGDGFHRFKDSNGKFVDVQPTLLRTFNGTAGNDTFTLHDVTGDGVVSGLDFNVVLGEAGTDTVTLSQNNVALDLTSLAANKMYGIEAINLTTTGNTVLLDQNTLSRMQIATSDKLVITSTAANDFELQGAWTFDGRVTQSGKDYLTYTDSSGRSVWIQDTMARSYTGTAGNDAFIVHDTSGDGKITGADFGTIDGKAGTDRLYFEQGNLTIDLTTLAAGAMNGIEHIDLSGYPNNSLILGNNTLTNMGTTTLRVTGEATSLFELQGTWTFQGVVAGYSVYEDTSGNRVEVAVNVKRMMHGTAGNDSFALDDITLDGIINASDFAFIEGGNGNDTISITGTGKTLDLSGIAVGVIKEIETINLTGGNKLILDDTSLTNLAQSPITVEGTAADSFLLNGAWTYTGTVGGYAVYTDGAGKQVRVNTAVRRIISGTEGDDALYIEDIDGDGIVNTADYWAVQGRGGDDTMLLQGGNKTLDLRGLGEEVVTGIETIDITGTGNNSIILDATTLSKMKSNNLKIIGDALDTFELQGSGWTLVSVSGGFAEYDDNNGSGRKVFVSDSMKRVYNGTAGNDTFTLLDTDMSGTITGANFGTIKGQGGQDTITVGGLNTTLDLSAITAGQIAGVSAINLTGQGKNAIIFDDTTLLKMGMGSTLTLDGDVNDTVVLNGNWVLVGNSATYATYQDVNGKTLEVSRNIQRAYVGTAANDSFRLEDITENGVITGSDFATINGNGGTDTLTLGGTGLNLDLTSLAAGKISGISAIDLSGAGTNRVLLNDTAFTGMGVTTLTVTGDAGDSFALDSTWTYQGKVGSNLHYTSAAGNTVYIADTMTRAYIGTAGNDVFVLDDLNGDGRICIQDFATIEGKGGSDTLTVTGTENLDFCSLLPGQVSGVTTVDLRGATNHVTLDQSTLTGMGVTSLTIKGDAADTFTLGGTWLYSGESAGYHQYHDTSGKTALIASGMQRTYTGVAGNDTFLLNDVNGDSIITAADFVSITGNGGSDTIAVQGNGLSLDLTGLAAGQITDVTTISLAGNGINHLKVDANTFTAMAQTTLTVEGEAKDTFELDPSWSFVSTNGTYATYTDGTNTLRVAAAVGILQTGTAGNDTFIIRDMDASGTITAGNIGRIIGNGGTDTIAINGMGVAVDLSGLSTDQVTGVSTIDLTGSGNNHISFADDIFNKMGVTQLTVTGNAGDTFDLIGTWTLASSDGTWITYASGTRSLRVAASLNRVYKGTTGNDVFELDDLDNSGNITAADFAKIIGNGGSDSIKISGANLSLDLTGLALGQVSGVSTIDVSGNGSNHVLLNAATFAGMGLTTLTLNGGNDDTFTLDNSWLFTSTDGTYATYTSGANTLLVSVAMQRQFTAGASLSLYDVTGDGVIDSADFAGIIGNGSTALTIGEAGMELNLTTLPAGEISGVSSINLTGNGSILALDASSLTHLGLTITDDLIVTGSATSEVSLQEGGWVYTRSESGSSVYTDASGREVFIAESLHVNLHAANTGELLTGGLESTHLYGGSGNDTLDGGFGGMNTLDGGTGNDTFLLRDMDGDTLITAADYAGIHGGGGIDVIDIQGTGITLDLLGMGTAIDGFEEINLGTGNTIRLDAASFAQASSGATLQINGAAGAVVDIADVSGTWATQAQQNINGLMYDVYTTTHNSTELTLLVHSVLAVSGL